MAARLDDPDGPSEDDTPITGVLRASELALHRHPELARESLEARYTLEGELARGGMGTVEAARDRRLDREVAIKRLAREASPAAVERFLREARLQAGLDHPAIPPVYDLGLEPDGRPFFVMRRLAGASLRDALRERNPEPESAERARLLEVFVEVCQAVAHAHGRGVLHLDLKPGNVLLGEHGEVHVLDWGVADAPARAAGAGDPVVRRHAEIAGTVGYMAPEHLRGDVALDARADVYALGCVLFEILAGEPLHRRSATRDAVTPGEPRPASPGEAPAVDPSPARRAPARAVSDALDRICARALAADRDARFPSARALAEAVEGVLAADRETQVREARVAAEVAAAEHALERLAAEADAAAEAAARGAAMRHAGRALALAPRQPRAAAVVRRLLFEPPARLPPAIAAALADDDDATRRANARLTLWSSGALLAITGALAVLGSLPAWLAAGMPAAAMLGGVVGLELERGRYTRLALPAVLIASMAALLLLSRVLGPLALPVALGTVVTMAAVSRLDAGRLAGAVAVAVLGPAAALALEAAGALAPTMRFVDGGVVLLADDAGLSPAVAAGVATAVAVAVVALAALVGRKVAALHHQRRRSLAVLAQHLEGLLPPVAPRGPEGP